MNFYETMMGQKFFANQLPRLIRSLEKIETALKQGQRPVMQATEVQPNFLTDLYYGNVKIGVCSEPGYSDQNVKRLLPLLKELEEKLTPEQWSLCLRYQEISNEFAMQEARRMFEHGFRLAHFRRIRYKSGKKGNF